MYFIEKINHLNDFIEKKIIIEEDFNAPKQNNYENDYENLSIYLIINDIYDVL